ncbi:hypothetical protein TNIN_51621 [Trichonephila inaurata madagascariensis]|uniref:Uncharacterized protein n=1 Tax=Trichonephila inaurata madagascariensis TaxID=2747483 RepID=A0A8X6YS51_9ARAC|nr:hypothetical protein TNIN_51621 [Trichonephila inaurata madagascariensis]
MDQELRAGIKTGITINKSGKGLSLTVDHTRTRPSCFNASDFFHGNQASKPQQLHCSNYNKLFRHEEEKQNQKVFSRIKKFKELSWKFIPLYRLAMLPYSVPCYHKELPYFSFVGHTVD